VLVLRDVLGFRAAEVAEMLDSTVSAVNSALKRARATLAQKLPAPAERQPAQDSSADDAIVTSFVEAYEAADVDAVVALLTDDVFISMPPMPFEYEGRDAASRFITAVLGSGRRFRLVPARANGQPALGAYVLGPDGISHGAGLFVLTLTHDRIGAMSRFENTVFPWFGLPPSLPAD
jgi:SnoaL-like domain/Sigma-70, region 4